MIPHLKESSVSEHILFNLGQKWEQIANVSLQFCSHLIGINMVSFFNYGSVLFEVRGQTEKFIILYNPVIVYAASKEKCRCIKK